jgi:hypothetical protein
MKPPAAVPIDQLIRTQRKSISLIVEPDARLVVRAPLRLPRAQIDAFVNSHADWIRSRQALARKHYRPPHQFAAGESFWYLGVQYPLLIVEQKEPALSLAEVFRLARSAQKRARAVFEAWYRQQARRVLEARLAHYTQVTGLQHKKLRISSARTRWGSCSSRGTLSFPWRLVMAPPEVIDYVVVHELCHLAHPNHSPAFWARVAGILPEYKAQRAWLKKHARELVLE